MTFEELMADLEKREAEEQHCIETLQKETAGLPCFVLRDATRTHGALIAPSAKKEGLYQASFFDARGFWGDAEELSPDTLIRAAVREYQMTERDDAFLEELTEVPAFCRQTALFWYRQQGADETAIRELRIINPPAPDEDGIDPLLGAFCRNYQQELGKRHVSLVPGIPARLGSDERTAITEAVTKNLIASHQLTQEKLSRYAGVLCFADPAIREAKREEAEQFAERIMGRTIQQAR